MMKYKGYFATVEYDDDAELFHGEVKGIRDVVTFQGKSVNELKQAFHDSVDEYIDWCARRGEEPEKPYSGRFLVRATPDIHRQVGHAASLEGKSVNEWVVDRLKQAVES